MSCIIGYEGHWNKLVKRILLLLSNCSGWSQVLRATTMGAPPAAPAPPTLRSASAKQINLTWGPPSLADMLYTLQMADPDSGHGFLNVYHGVDIEYTCTGLTRSTAYRFRVSRGHHFYCLPDKLALTSPLIRSVSQSDRRVNPISFHISSLAGAPSQFDST